MIEGLTWQTVSKPGYPLLTRHSTAAITGEMVFGGVDINKYSGFLQKVPTDPSDP